MLIGLTAGAPDLPPLGRCTVKESFSGIPSAKDQQRILCHEDLTFCDDLTRMAFDPESKFYGNAKGMISAGLPFFLIQGAD